MSYNGTVRASASGTFYNDANTYAHDAFRLNDPANDSNSVYGRNRTSFNAGANSSEKTTGEYSYATTPYTKHFKTSLEGSATKAMAADTVCVQLGWPVPDKCSLTSYVSFNY